MAVTHKNRKGATYYLLEGKTPKGKPKYYFSRKSEGCLVESLPEGYEIYEKPDSAQVYLRKPVQTHILPQERELVLRESREAAGTNAILVDVEGDSIVVYFAEGNDAVADLVFGSFGMPSSGIAKLLEWRVTHGHYMKMLRFTLVDADRRLFSVDRWCFRGSIDNWFFLGGAGTLANGVRRFARHLGQESFFELM